MLKYVLSLIAVLGPCSTQTMADEHEYCSITQVCREDFCIYTMGSFAGLEMRRHQGETFIHGMKIGEFGSKEEAMSWLAHQGNERDFGTLIIPRAPDKSPTHRFGYTIDMYGVLSDATGIKLGPDVSAFWCRDVAFGPAGKN